MHRLFIALTPPEPVRDALIDTMEALDGARWQDDEQLHLTLRFVGAVDGHRAEDLAQALSRVPVRPLTVRLAGVGHFARRGVPSAIWARAEPSPALRDLRRSVERACIAAGLPPETRAFHPHVTIARLNRQSAPPDAWLARHGRFGVEWLARDFALFESHLSHSGALYEEITCYRAQDG